MQLYKTKTTKMINKTQIHHEHNPQYNLESNSWNIECTTLKVSAQTPFMPDECKQHDFDCETLPSMCGLFQNENVSHLTEFQKQTTVRTTRS